MADEVQMPDPSTLPPPAPLYLGPDPTLSDGHQVLADGVVHTVLFDGLTPSLQNDAIQAAQPQPTLPTSPDGGPALFSMGQKQQDQLHSAIATAPIGAQQQAAINNATGTVNGPTPDTLPIGAGSPTGSAQPAAGPQMAPSADQLFGGAKATGTGGGGGAASKPDPNMQIAANDKLAGANTAYQLGSQMSHEQLALNQKQAAEEAARNATQQIKDAANERTQQEMLQRSQAATQDFMNAKIDPNSYWNDKSTGQKIGASIGMILSGFGAGITGKDNLAIKSLEDAQNRDIEAQKFNIEHKKDASEQYTKLFQNYREAGLDQRQAFSATGLAIKQKNLMDWDNIALQHGDQKALATLQDATGAIREDNAMKAAALQKELADTNLAKASTSASYANAAKTRAETAQVGASAADAKQLQAAQQNIGKYGFQQLPPEQQRALVQNAAANKRLIPGVGVTQREVSPDEQNRVQDLGTAKKLLAEIDKASSGTVWSPDAESKAQALKVLLPKVLGSQAKVGTGMEAALNNIVADNPAAPWSHQAHLSKALKSTLNDVETEFHKNLGTTKFNPIQFTPDKNAQ